VIPYWIKIFDDSNSEGVVNSDSRKNKNVLVSRERTYVPA
jgi:hypothetical protein